MVFRRPSKTRCPRATLTAHHRPVETRDPPAQKDRWAHTMATHRRMHTNQTVFSNTPHERGALSKPTVLLDSLGIIPACAGSTTTTTWTSWPTRDHPRMRGEHPSVARIGGPLAGIIPACAGSTAQGFRPRLSVWDHPRMRGEHIVTGLDLNLPHGSSPHAGEHIVAMYFFTIRARSSPHARGALSETGGRKPVRGIIPACAESTRFGGWSGASRRDHPRVRGEHSSHCARVLLMWGSSPHARGAPW